MFRLPIHRLSRRPHRKIALLVAVSLTFISGDAHAATATSNFTVQLTITASCTIGSASTLDFGSQGVLTSAIDQTGTIAVQCTNTTPFNIGLDAGNGAGTTVTTRKMIGAGGATVAYALYSDSGRTSNWGNTPGVDAISSTGTGAAQSFTVFGRVPAQATPAPATYTDTVTVTVTY